MDARKYLVQYLELKDQIECKNAENKQLLYIAGGVASAPLGERVQTSMNLHKSEDATLRYMRTVDENKAEIELCKEKMAEILSVIAKLRNTTFRKILLKHYTENKPLNIIADEIGYSYSHTKELHMSALRKIQPLINSLPNPLE